MKYMQRNEQKSVSVDLNSLNISPVVAQILINRGIASSEKELNDFLYPDFNNLYDPFLFKGMDIAVSRIKLAIERGELICVYGDYDCDGIMASSIMAMCLYRLGAKVNVYIPNRKDGYGMNPNAIDYINNKNVGLIITVDCGITSVECVERANSYGIDVIVTDHHEQGEVLPNALCILDAKAEGQTYPFKELCGAGVAGKIVQALCGNSAIKPYLDYIAVATVADLVPLVDENRILVKSGLMLMNKFLRPNLKAILEYCNVGSEIKASHIGYQIAPIINACGRLGDANDAVQLMVTQSPEEMSELAEKCFNYNEKRKKIEQDLAKEAIKQIAEEHPKSVVVYGDDWDIGVIGILASRLTEKYNCPSVVLSRNPINNSMHGSCRSIPGIDIHLVLTCLKKYLVSFGGHKAAAGLAMDFSVYKDFKAAFSAEIEKYGDEAFSDIKYYDLDVKTADINDQLLDGLSRFEPCGFGNPQPYLRISDANYVNTCVMGKNSAHYRTIIADNTGRMQGVAFNSPTPRTAEHLDLIVSPEYNHYEGTTYIQCKIISCVERADYAGNNDLSQSAVYGYVVKDEPIEVLGLTSSKAKQFHDNNIHTVKDLLHYLPKRFLDYRFPKGADAVNQGDICSMVGTLKEVKIYSKVIKGVCVDPNGYQFSAVWFHQDYVTKMLFVGTQYIFCGKININPPYMFNQAPEVQIMPQVFGKDINKYMTLLPVYKQIKGMSIDYLMNTMCKALDSMANVDYLDKKIIDEFDLISEKDAMIKIHRPRSDKDIELAKYRQAFDQLFKFNFKLKYQNKGTSTETQYKMSKHIIFDMLDSKIPYSLTNDQRKTIEGMAKIMKSEKLTALVQGDVGSGKTIVAFYMMCLAHENGYQSCLMAPTEVLAKQHYEDLTELVESLGIKVAYLRGGMKAKEKNAMLKDIASGEITMVVGTHAVIQDSVKFKALSLAIVDEQHRFGVVQRNKFLNLESKPHLITMSATPIPRTMSMALFGDNISTFDIKEKPSGRRDVITKTVESDEEANEFMYTQIEQGHQCYVICPLIEESKNERMAEVDSVEQEYHKLCDYFADRPVRIECINGRMKREEITERIQKFADGEADILVSTTIVEVGVNVPNATAILIKSSERFGLAQAHQLRGRVGRSSIQSYCLLQTNKDDAKAEILCNTCDGFEIAKQDILLRGTGDFLGTQQTGSNADVMLMLAEPELYKKIAKLNDSIFNDEQMFNKYKYLIE